MSMRCMTFGFSGQTALRAINEPSMSFSGSQRVKLEFSVIKTGLKGSTITLAFAYCHSYLDFYRLSINVPLPSIDNTGLPLGRGADLA